jgi:hypothetical protein
MAKRYFNTYRGAERHLEFRKRCAYKRIANRGDVVLSDDSRVIYDNGFGTRILKKDRWIVWMQITTQQMLNDIKNMKSSYEFIQECEQKLIEDLQQNISKEIQEKIKDLNGKQ